MAIAGAEETPSQPARPAADAGTARPILLLVSADHAGCRRVERLLHGEEAVALRHVTARTVIPAAVRSPEALVILDAALVAPPVLALARLVRHRAPRSSIAVLTQTTNPELDRGLLAVPVTALLLHADVTPTLMLTLAGISCPVGVSIVSSSLFSSSPSVDPDACLIPGHLSGREQSILRALAQGLPEHRIAETEGWHQRTVERTVEQLRTRCGEVSTFGLGVRARAAGIGLPPLPALQQRHLSEQQWLLLRDLALGRSERALASAGGMSTHTLWARVDRLKEVLEAPTLFVLGMRAYELGFRLPAPGGE